jgi:hypothetical protein
MQPNQQQKIPKSHETKKKSRDDYNKRICSPRDVSTCRTAEHRSEQEQDAAKVSVGSHKLISQVMNE